MIHDAVILAKYNRLAAFDNSVGLLIFGGRKGGSTRRKEWIRLLSFHSLVDLVSCFIGEDDIRLRILVGEVDAIRASFYDHLDSAIFAHQLGLIIFAELNIQKADLNRFVCGSCASFGRHVLTVMLSKLLVVERGLHDNWELKHKQGLKWSLCVASIIFELIKLQSKKLDNLDNLDYVLYLGLPAMQQHHVRRLIPPRNDTKEVLLA